VPAGAGTSVHPAGWKSLLGDGYLEFVCQQVRVRHRRAAILPAQRPTGNTIRMWRSPVPHAQPEMACVQRRLAAEATISP